MKHCLCIFSLFCFFAVSAQAQGQYTAVGGYVLARPSSNFSSLPGIPNCCPNFTGGDGQGGFGSLSVEIPLKKQVHFVGVLMLQGFVHQIQTEQTTTGLINDAPGDIRFLHTMNGSFFSVGAGAGIAYRIANRIPIQGLFRLDVPLQAQFDQREVIADNTPGTFTNKSRVRNSFAGDIPNRHSIIPVISAGVSYEMPLNASGSLFLVPSMAFDANLLSFSSAASWRHNAFRFGLGIQWRSLPAPPVRPKDTIQPPPPPPPPPDLIVSAVAMTDTVIMEEFVSTQLHPLLPYIFFDEMSDNLPARYQWLSKQQTESFSERDAALQGALPLHYSVLNVIGARMRAYPTEKITVRGSTSGALSEKNNLALAQKRTERIADYLQSVWNISKERIEFSALQEPLKPSNINRIEGVEENRRVEIYSSAPEITDPAIVSDTSVKDIPDVRFVLASPTSSAIKQWTFTVQQSGIALWMQSGAGAMPKELLWKPKISALRNVGRFVSFTLAAEDAHGQTAATEPQILPIKLITVQEKRRRQEDDREFERYSLVLFDFDKWETSNAHKRIVSFIKKRIAPEAIVTVVGGTDNTGEAKYNKDLSTRRAKEIAALLGMPNITVVGKGGENPNYGNNSPEGRFLNRTVTITVENPVR